MHLKQLKLAGFKSFVDPTVVCFPSQLVAVLGPNGCGKSNIIDAVRWVMGESSAKNLRGESMTDVIFNGSSSRKSLGQASVELLFDNSLGRLAGPFAAYGEIAVKRVLTRDGDSSYYLNNVRCRRKDITDIFLGTGAGARGYSIIGQGTISRLIEAKPEELRVYLEEAAGVSKYKERRRETLQRIEQTRENLTRVADIREELDKQLQRLERQAKSAERYLVLKEDERLCRAEILALKWQAFHAQQLVKQKELHALVVSYEQQQSVLTHHDTEKTLLGEKWQSLNDKNQDIQVQYYQIGTEMVRLEEMMQQQAREKKRLAQDRQQLQDDWQKTEAQWIRDKAELQQSEAFLSQLERDLVRLKEQFKESESQCQSLQQQQMGWELRWQDAQSSFNQVKNDVHLARLSWNHLEQKRQQTSNRMENLRLEQSANALDVLLQSRASLEEKQIQLRENQVFDAEQWREGNETVIRLRTQLKEIEQQWHSLQDEFLQANSHYAVLVATQKAATQGKNVSEKENIFHHPKLVDSLRVEPEWQLACEMVLDEALNAFVLVDIESIWSDWLLHENHRGHWVSFKSRIQRGESKSKPCLADKIEGQLPVFAHHFESIYIAKNLDEARSWWLELAENESILLASGVWLGKGWVKFSQSAVKNEMGVLARQQKINEMLVEVDALQNKLEVLRSQRDEKFAQLQDNERFLSRFQSSLNASNEALRNNQHAILSAVSSLEQAQSHRDRLAVEHEELAMVLEEAIAEQLVLTSKIEALQKQCTAHESIKTQVAQEKELWLTRLDQQQKQVNEARELLHRTELEHDRQKNKTSQLAQQITREHDHLTVLQERLEHLAEQCLQAAEPEKDFTAQWTAQWEKHHEMEVLLSASREQLSSMRLDMDALEKQIREDEAIVKKLQDVIGETRLEEHALSARASSVQDTLIEQGMQAETLLVHFSDDVTQARREHELLAISEKIKRLGAINLAAIEEFTTEQQRKQYLDEQWGDLSQALTALEIAIETIDKESKNRLEVTFDEVNTSFKILFPRLFGGGQAALQLTCDNLLEAGIVVMAQPPGKRNSTIHLLSGGEKAMTAVALVFAIFQLNPSPFCMLDEVDAPLDDVNVGRFCDLVKEMSQFVQFLFITHNKVTMELADHLIGVTMREPGVSRLVAVDVQRALTME